MVSSCFGYNCTEIFSKAGLPLKVNRSRKLTFLAGSGVKSQIPATCMACQKIREQWARRVLNKFFIGSRVPGPIGAGRVDISTAKRMQDHIMTR